LKSTILSDNFVGSLGRIVRHRAHGAASMNRHSSTRRG
jgi:hypothetical protein